MGTYYKSLSRIMWHVFDSVDMDYHPWSRFLKLGHVFLNFQHQMTKNVFIFLKIDISYIE